MGTFAKSTRKCKDGLTFVEIIFATLIFAIFAIGGVAFAQRSGESISTSRKKRIAVEAANALLEQFRAVNYALIPAGSMTSPVTINGQSQTATLTVNVIDLGA